MKKPFSCQVKSGVKCSVKGCQKMLKANVVARKPTADKCFLHFQLDEAKRGHFIKAVPYHNLKRVEAARLEESGKKESRQVV